MSAAARTARLYVPACHHTHHGVKRQASSNACTFHISTPARVTPLLYLAAHMARNQRMFDRPGKQCVAHGEGMGCKRPSSAAQRQPSPSLTLASTSNSEPCTQNSVTTQGGSRHMPMKSTMLGCLKEAITSASFWSSLRVWGQQKGQGKGVRQHKGGEGFRQMHQ